MKGSDGVWSLRRGGSKPKGIWVARRPSKHALDWFAVDDLLPYPEVEILESEIPEFLDLRFAVGLTIHVSGGSVYSKEKRLMDAFLKAGAKRVISVCGEVIMDSLHGDWDGYVPE